MSAGGVAPLATCCSTANTSSAATFFSRSDSPVAEDSSHLTPWPEMKTPSAGTTSPVKRCMTSPTMTSKTEISADLPERTTLTPVGAEDAPAVSERACSGVRSRRRGRGAGGLEQGLGVAMGAVLGGAPRDDVLESHGAVKGGLVVAEAGIAAGAQALLQSSQAAESVEGVEALRVEQLGQLTRREGELVVLDDEQILVGRVRG
ncbi:22054372-053d-49fb-9ee5-f8dc7c6a3952 [Thermothielavioides terrestris]|uniref:22054372-053d-49fb-9ee5-f8dc7c6a3952 n=1 Tax=Thermothielavioides terrestris TaxID=2587410 RepID=A0A3S4F616_9PEZI|nr:22054372-053d-49fb-9ee5-f8dc7c6a3952 [Thermothielavioides terrestris]